MSNGNKLQTLLLTITLACSVYLTMKVNKLENADNINSFVPDVYSISDQSNQQENYVSLRRDIAVLTGEIENLRLQIDQKRSENAAILENKMHKTSEDSSNSLNSIEDSYVPSDIDKSGLYTVQNMISKGVFDETDKEDLIILLSNMSNSAREESMLEIMRAVNSQKLSVDLGEIFR